MSKLAFAECTNNKNPNIPIAKPDTIYTDNEDGTITDKVTGLMWQKCNVGLSGTECDTGTTINVTWQAALEIALENTDMGYNDWRLPNIKELLSLVETACFDPAINNSIFPNTTTGSHWSSTPYHVDDGVWGIHFGSGNVGKTSKDARVYIRLVRDPASSS